jgi:EAL domain-containing protein (putative c-di-GMP-specific phosphodiesterase class I)
MLRILGCAFAAADLLFEASPDGKVAMALGAGQRVRGKPEAALVGEDWLGWIAPADRGMVRAMSCALKPGERRGPVTVQLEGEGRRMASLSLVALPHLAPNVSCALTLGGTGEAAPDTPFRLHGADGFGAMVERLVGSAARSGLELDLALVEIGVEAARDARVVEAVASVLRADSYGGAGAARLSDERFAVVRPRGDTEALRRRLEAEAGAPAELTALPLSANDPAGLTLRAARTTLDRFLRDGLGADSGAFAGDFAARLDETRAQARRFLTMVEERSFRLVFQPIVSLSTGAAHHYEVLTRFDGDESPFELIKLAEELDLIERLDLAVTRGAINQLRAKGSGLLKLAVNISARSLLTSGFVDRLLKALGESADLDLPRRLHFEITESAAMGDLATADANIGRLRALGYRVALDDFGAGAASLAYLQQLGLDVVKIDGRYIRDLQTGGREATFVKHLVKMCGELKIQTLAEMVETQAAEDAVRRAGVDLAQGWRYGAAEEIPRLLNPIKGRSGIRPALSR